MTAKGRTSTVFGKLKDIISESHIFFPVKSAAADILPCIHVLCNGCLGKITSRTGKEAGDKIVCKLCKLEFDVPSSKVLRDRKATKELLSELSKAAIDIQQWCEICRDKYPSTWSEISAQSATVHCTVCAKYECLSCVETHCSYHRTVAKRSHLTNRINHERHRKQLEVRCIACGTADCFSCLVDSEPYQMKNDFDLDIDLESLNALSKQLSASKAEVEEQTKQFGSSVTKAKTQIEASCEEQMQAVQNEKQSALDQLRTIAAEAKQQLEEKRNIFDRLSMKANSFRKSCDSIHSTGKLEDKFWAAGAALNKTDELMREFNSSNSSRRPMISCESSGRREKKYIETSHIHVHWIDDRPRDDAITHAKTKKDETRNEAVGYLYDSAHQVPPSTQGYSIGRSENATETFYTHINQDVNYKDRENSFPAEFAKYKEMLETMKNKMIPDKIRTKVKQRSSLLKKEDSEKLCQQFDHMRGTQRSDKQETRQWKSVEKCHQTLVKLARQEVEGDRLKPILHEINVAIEDMLKQLSTVVDNNKTNEEERTKGTVGNMYESGYQVTPAIPEKRYQQGLSNFGNTCYFNAVIQCLCQTFPLLGELYLRNTLDQPLTEAFVGFLNYRSVGALEEKTAFYKFFEQLVKSSPKFDNFRQHDSHDLFIHFLNDLRSEERQHLVKCSQTKLDPKQTLTTVDKVFGGHFITMYACLECGEPYFVCECLLDISLPICIPRQQHYSGAVREGADQMSGQRRPLSTVGECQNLGHASYNYQGKRLKRDLLKALNEEQGISEGGGRRHGTRPVALTECLRFYTEAEHIPEGYLCLACQDGSQAAASANAKTMPPALKRTLIYNPPAVLVLHLKRFERTATGFTKRSDIVSYEELLDLGPYCSSDCLRIDPKDKNIWYSLYGVVVHIGSLDSGHYIAYVKVGNSNAKATKTFLQQEFLEREQVAFEQKTKFTDQGNRVERKVEWQPKPTKTGGRWVHVSDSNTRDTTLQEALNQEAFMLFYERVPNRRQ